MYKILYVNHVGQISGAERVLQNLVSRLDRNKYLPIIAAPEEGKFLNELRASGVQVYPIPTKLLIRTKNPVKLFQYLLRFWKVTKTLKTIISQEEIALVHANSFSAHLYSIFAAKLTRRPLLWHMHDIITPRWFNWFFVWFAGKMADRIIVVSQAVKKSVVDFAISPEKCGVVYNGMDCDQEQPTPTECQQIRMQLNIPENVVMITMVGTITLWKGQHIFIQAANQILQSKSTPELRFVIVGDIVNQVDATYKTQIYNLVEQLGIKGKVIFTGFRPDVPLIMTGSDIIIHSSIKPDPLPTVILEAMLLKKPVIASRIGGVPEIVEPNVTGLLFTPENVDELTDKIKQLILAPELRNAMGEAGRKRIEHSFNINQNVTTVEEIYLQVLSSQEH